MRLRNIHDKKEYLRYTITPKRATIALLVSTTSRGINRVLDVTTLPIIRILLKSFSQTVIEAEKREIAFRFYIGYDDNDAYYCQKEVRQQIAKQFRTELRGMDIRVIFRCFHNERQSPVFVWNRLFKIAHSEGCDYFYQLGDDILFISNGWTINFIESYESSFRDGIGLIGASDLNNPNLITQAFVGRIHYELFGSLYPSSFQNWYSDDWLFNVYNHYGRCQWIKNVFIMNCGGKERYIIDKKGKDLLYIEQEKAIAILNEYIQ